MLVDLVAELSGVLPGLSPILAETYINRAWRDVRNARLWSWQVADSALVCPGQITAGKSAITQYVATVTMDAAASAALLPYVSGTPLLTQLQIRFGSSPTVGQVYQIISVNSTVPTALVLTLDRVLVEVTAAASSYHVYRCYVVAPVADFTRWVAIVDMVNGIPPLKLDYTSVYFDQRDPQRASQGMSYFCGAFKNASSGLALYELWPHPVQGQTFYVQYLRRGADLSDSNPLQPDVIPDALLVDRALGWHAYPWAQTNVGHFPALSGATGKASINWSAAIQDAKARYLEGYRDVKRIDDDIRVQSIISRGHGLRGGQPFNWPIDANFIQSHLVPL